METTRLPRSASTTPLLIRRVAVPLYGIEFLGSVAGTLLSIGIFFFMNHRFGWQARENFLLAAAQGVVYVPGALLAGRVTARFGRRASVAALYGILTILCVAAWTLASEQGSSSAVAVVGVLLVYTFAIGISWPVLESLVATGDAPGMARRIAAYNVVWPAAGWVAIGLEGAVIRYWPAGMFLVPAACHLLGLLFLAKVWTGAADSVPFHAHPLAEPLLLRKRTLALWLSRTALPATYTVVYGLMPLMPSLPTVGRLPTAMQTVVADVWLITRWIAFVALALSGWWHTRPRVLLWAAVAMLVAFFGMTLPPTHGASPMLDLVSLIAWQVPMGLALGMIYSGSLYFGMVLSEGSTEHGGYHEALIGLGWMIGPAAGAAAQWASPGALWAGIAAVGTIIALSVMAVIITAVVLGDAHR